jgi:hypothetical protein
VLKVYRGQLPVVERSPETAALMLGSDWSSGYLLEMICADSWLGPVSRIRQQRLTSPVPESSTHVKRRVGRKNQCDLGKGDLASGRASRNLQRCFRSNSRWLVLFLIAGGEKVNDFAHCGQSVLTPGRYARCKLLIRSGLAYIVPRTNGGESLALRLRHSR